MGTSMDCSVGIYCITVLHWLQGHSCLTVVCTMDRRGISTLVHEASLAPAFSLTLVSVGLFLSYVVTPFTAVVQCLLPFLKYTVTETPLASLTGLAVSCNRSVGGGRIWLCSDMRAVPGFLSQKPPLQPLYYENMSMYNVIFNFSFHNVIKIFVNRKKPV